MALYFASSNDMLERPELRDKKVVPKVEGSTTTLGKTNPLASGQFVKPEEHIKFGPDGQPKMGMATRAPLRFAESGQKQEPTPVRDWANENVLRPAAGMAAAAIGGMDPAAILSQGATSTARLADPFYDYYQAGKQRLGGTPDYNTHAVSQGFQQLQEQAPLAGRQAMDVLMYGGLGAGVPHAATPEQFARYGMRPEFAPEMPRPPGLQTPMREILAGASNTPEPKANRLKFAEEPSPGASPAPRAYREPGQVKALATDEMNRLERNAPLPAQREASPETRQRLETTMASQDEASKYGRGSIGEAGVRMLADKLSPTKGLELTAKLPKPERMGPELTTGRQPREAAHHREFQRLFTERFPTATRMMPGAPEAGIRKPKSPNAWREQVTEMDESARLQAEYERSPEYKEALTAMRTYYAEGRAKYEAEAARAASEEEKRKIWSRGESDLQDGARPYRERVRQIETRLKQAVAQMRSSGPKTAQYRIEHPRGLRNEADPRTSAARKPGARGPGDTGRGKIVSRQGAATYPQQPKPRVLTEGPTRPSGGHEVKGPKGGKIGPRDEARALKGTYTPSANPVKNAWHAVQTILSPSTASGGARSSAQIMRASIGENKRHMAQQVQRLEGYRKQINALDPEAKKAIRDYLQGHEDVLPALKLLKAPWMSFVTAINETRKAMERQISSLPDYQKMEFEENHLAQYWQESMRDQKKMAAKGHFIAKKYESYRAGEAAGLHAKFDDPIQIVFQEMRDMANFLAKEYSLDEMTRLDYAKKLGSKEREPVNTTLLQHVGKRRIYAAEDVARAWNNQWGPGVFENKDLGRLYMDTVRAMNASTAFTLGLSTKHAFNIAYGAIELNMQSAVKAAAAGRPITAAKHLAGAAGAPVSLFRKGSALHDVFTGAAAPKDERMARVASLLAQSNMNVTEFEPIYRSSGNMNWVEAYKVGLLGKEFATDIKGAANLRKPLTAAGHAYNLVSKTMDSMMHPLFAYAIPRVKAGAFFMKMNDFMDSHPESTDWEKVQEAQRIADSIENVEGMMTQGNIMVAPLLKQSANLILQAPGWTFGALRTYGQGAADIAKGTAKLVAGKKVETLSENAAYTIAAALTTAGVCAFAQAIMGGGPPTSPLDLVLPKTGGKNPDGTPERFAPFGNVKDLVGYYHDWKGELSNKVRGPWKAAYETLTNHDWAKHVIADPMDPWQKQVKDVVGNILKNIGEPISVQQFGTATPDSNLPNWARVAGFTPAGQWASNPQRTQAFKRRNEVKEHRQRLRFERKQENQRAPVTSHLQFAKPEEAPRQRLRFAPQ